MIQVAQWSCTLALFRESGKLLNKGQFLILYGLFKICNKDTTQSNYVFDNSLKCKMFFGVLKILRKFVMRVIKYIYQEDIIRMPANNFLIIYRKVS